MVGARARACVTTEGYPLAGLQQQLRRRVTAMEENLDRPQLAAIARPLSLDHLIRTQQNFLRDRRRGLACTRGALAFVAEPKSSPR